MNVPRLISWAMVIWAALQVAPAGAQGNIDAGKTPAQIFGDTCSACHRSARNFRRATASFLRGHYTAGSEEATAMANYLAGVSSGSASREQRRPAAEGSRQSRQEQAKSGQSKSGQSKARASASAQVRVVPEEHPVEPAPPPEPPAPPVPVLEPFEE